MADSGSERGRVRKVVLEGKLGLKQGEQIKEVLQQALKESEEVLISLAEGVEADLAFLQILCGAHGSALRHKKHLTLEAADRESFVKVLGDAGYLLHAKCRYEDLYGCLWRRGRGIE